MYPTPYSGSSTKAAATSVDTSNLQPLISDSTPLVCGDLSASTVSDATGDLRQAFTEAISNAVFNTNSTISQSTSITCGTLTATTVSDATGDLRGALNEKQATISDTTSITCGALTATTVSDATGNLRGALNEKQATIGPLSTLACSSVTATTVSDFTGNLRTAINDKETRMAFVIFNTDSVLNNTWGNDNYLTQVTRHKSIGTRMSGVGGNSTPNAGKILILQTGIYRLRAQLTPQCLNPPAAAFSSNGQGRSQFGAYFGLDGANRLWRGSEAGAWTVAYLRNDVFGQENTVNLDYVVLLPAGTEITLNTRIGFFGDLTQTGVSEERSNYRLYASVIIEKLEEGASITTHAI